MSVWSKRKKLIESFWAESLDMVIYTTEYRYCDTHGGYTLPRFWIVLDKVIIWDFPGPFIDTGKSGKQDRLPMMPYFGDRDGAASYILDEYVSRPRDELFEDFERDKWELGDILRAADKRIGKARLMEWSKTLDPANPALKVLAARFPRRENYVG